MQLSKYFLKTAGSLALVCAVASCRADTSAKAAGPAHVEIRKTGDEYRMYVNGQPFYIKGAGMEYGNAEKLAAHGGNSFRTWRTDNAHETGRQVLDNAQSNGLYVLMGLEMKLERHGFNYSDPVAVARQKETIRAEILKYKDHPALLGWDIGNELNLNATNMNVWNAVNDISKMIHEIDPNHPTTTSLAGMGKELMVEIKARATDLDFLSVQMYADIVNLPKYLKETGWTGPYVVTEWGATGHWEVAKTSWGVPIENDSTTKARFYRERYQTAIASDKKQCLGSYVFLWGQKQERTPTWYGMFLDTGEDTETVDVLQYLWTGKWPQNRSPQVKDASLDGKKANDSIRLHPGETYTAKVDAHDDDNDTLAYHWEIMPESTDLKTGGDYETKPKSLPDLILNPATNEITLTAPEAPGAYRLFFYAYDGKGHAAHVNVPFYVDATSKIATAR